MLTSLFLGARNSFFLVSTVMPRWSLSYIAVWYPFVGCMFSPRSSRRKSTPNPGFFRLIPYTPVPPTAIAACGSRRQIALIYDCRPNYSIITSQIFHITEGHVHRRRTQSPRSESPQAIKTVAWQLADARKSTGLKPHTTPNPRPTESEQSQKSRSVGEAKAQLGGGYRTPAGTKSRSVLKPYIPHRRT